MLQTVKFKALISGVFSWNKTITARNLIQNKFVQTIQFNCCVLISSRDLFLSSLSRSAWQKPLCTDFKRSYISPNRSRKNKYIESVNRWIKPWNWRTRFASKWPHFFHFHRPYSFLFNVWFCLLFLLYFDEKGARS